MASLDTTLPSSSYPSSLLPDTEVFHDSCGLSDFPPCVYSTAAVYCIGVGRGQSPFVQFVFVSREVFCRAFRFPPVWIREPDDLRSTNVCFDFVLVRVYAYVSWSAVYTTAYRRRKTSSGERTGKWRQVRAVARVRASWFLALRPPALLCLPMGLGYTGGPRYGYTGRRGKDACVFT